MARSVCSRWSTTEPSSACPSASWARPDPERHPPLLGRLQGPTGRAWPGRPGVTTDGSGLYPEPLKESSPDVPRQVCEFHVIKEITKAVLHALATTRKKLRDRIPKQPRGRPRKAERARVPQGHPTTTAGEQVVRTSIPVRSTSADRGSEDNLAADHARVGARAACGRSWRRSTDCSTAAAGRRRRWLDWLSYGDA